MNLLSYITQKMKVVVVVVSFLFLPLISSSCEKDENLQPPVTEQTGRNPLGSGSGNSSTSGACGGLIGTFQLSSINDELPYYSIYIDNDNYSKIHSGHITFRGDGTWESSLVYDQSVSGNVERNKKVLRDGTYTCDYGIVDQVETDGSDQGTGNINGSEYTLSTSMSTYVYRK